jgi:hypothetical protein
MLNDETTHKGLLGIARREESDIATKEQTFGQISVPIRIYSQTEKSQQRNEGAMRVPCTHDKLYTIHPALSGSQRSSYII